MIYEKNPLNIEQQITQLKQRGLIVEDKLFAKHYLSHVGYYRLAGYWWTMQEDKTNHRFKKDSKFEGVISLYKFDREFRVLLFDIIEKIEISLRAKLILHLSIEFGPWWFQDAFLFSNTQALIKTLSSIQEEVERSKEIFIKEHKKKYKDDLRFPPAWKTLELTSFGALSKLYGNLKNNLKVKDSIAKDYGAVNHTYLPSWLESIAQIRNFCAHHSRLWNKIIPSTPKLLSSPPNIWLNNVPSDTQKIYIHLCIMKYMLNTISPENLFSENLKKLFENYPSVDKHALGFINDWQSEPLWL